MSDSFDYDYDTGSYTKNPVQVTRYRQNIQRFRDYGNVGQQSAPISEGRLKEGIQPGGYKFSPPSAGVSADFYRDSRMRDPNQPPLDTSQISSLQYNRLFFEKDDKGDGTGTTSATQTSSNAPRRRFNAPRRETTAEGVAVSRRGLLGFGRRRTTVTPFTPQQTQAIEQTRATREQRASAAPMQEPTRTPAPRPLEPNPIQRVEPSTPTARERTPIQQRAIEQIQEQRRVRQQRQSPQQPQQPQQQQQSPVSQRLDEIFGRLREGASAPAAAQSSTSRSKKRVSRSGLGKVGKAIVKEALSNPQARGYLDQ